jgi:hypothetical protein
MQKALFLLLVLTSATTKAQSPDNLIEDIMKKCASIDSASGYFVMMLDAEDFLDETPDGGARLTGFFEGDTVRKAVDWIGLSYGVQSSEYYYHEGSLIMARYREERYTVVDSLGGFDYERLTTTFEGIFYFAGAKLIYSDQVVNEIENPNPPAPDKILIAARQRLDALSKRRR